MRLKSYFARNMEAAMELARKEMGPEAMIVNSRPSPPEAKHLGEYEVVFAATPALSSKDAAESGDAADPNEALARELFEMRKQMEELKKSLSRPGRSAPLWAPSSDMYDLFSRLLARGIDADTAQEILAAIYARLSGDPLADWRSRGKPSLVVDRDRLHRSVTVEMENRLSVDAGVGRIVALAGPTGSGKTTALVNLAATCGLAARRPVHIISMDSYRIAAAEQLRTYASILGVGFQALETTRSLGQALEEHRGKDLILIDTPGYGPQDMDQAADLAAFLSGQTTIETHLVLPASMNAPDLFRAAERFEVFHPAKLIFTRLDETESCGAVFCHAARSGKPLSFFGFGQQIPENFEAATKARVIDSILEEQAERALSAA